MRRLYRSGFPLVIVVAVAACGGADEENSTPTVAVTPAAGGMVLPAAVAVPTATVEVVSLSPGQLLIAIDELRLYADANRQAIVMNQYGASTQFTLLAPSGDYLDYPVTVEGADWVRLRADDGLVGWAPADELTASE